MSPLRILHLEDDPLDAELVSSQLARDGIEASIRLVSTRGAYQQALDEGAFDLILADNQLPGFSGMEALRAAREVTDLPFILLSGTIGEERAVELLKSGATDCVLKGSLGRLGLSVERACREAEERRQLATYQRRLEVSHAQFQQLLQANVIGIVIADLTGRIIQANDVYLATIGYTREELEAGDVRWDSITPPEWQHQDEKAIAQLREVGVCEPFEKCYEHRDGSLVPVYIGGTLLPGPADKVIAFILDLTPLRQMEARYLQAQKLEAVGRLAGGVAHDFNNLLTAMMGYAALLDQALPRDSQLREDVAEIRRGAISAASLTHRLLTFSRKQTPRPQVIDINRIVRRMIGLLRRLIGEDIELVVRPGEGLSAVRVDPGQLEQVLVNLAVNARDAMPQGGRLTIETENLSADEGARVSLSVRDTGHGIDPELMDRLFEPFFTTKSLGHGTGLGLATVKEIVERNDGTIGVESRPDEGAVFEVVLPACDAPLDLPDEPEEAETQGGGETILLVEDDTAVLGLMERLLRGAGYRLLSATQAVEAEQLSSEFAGTIDLLVVDLVLPKFSGELLARRLREQRPHLRLLYVSGYGPGTMTELRGPLLCKPFAPNALLSHVREALDREDGPNA